MKKNPLSILQLTVFFISALVLSGSYYLQYAKGFEPCPLCLMQRICVVFILVFSVINLFHHKIASRQAFTMAQCLLALLGLYFALRQLWLLSLPGDQIPACLPGLAVLIHYFPWQDLVRALFWGSGDCTEIRQTWMGLSLPLWSALYFIIISILSGIAYSQRHKRLISH